MSARDSFLLRARALAAPAFLLTLAAFADGCGSKTPVVERPRDIAVTLTSATRPSSRTERLPITFDAGSPDAQSFTIDLEMKSEDGSTRTSFTGPKAWVRLTLSPAGQIAQILGPKGEDDPDVAGPNVHFSDGVAKGITVKVIGAYGDTRIIAQDVGFVPAAPGTISQCANGRDDDGNGYADWPNDPDCLFLNDDSEEPVVAAFGSSPIVYYELPTVHDVQVGTSSPFLAKQVDVRAAAPQDLVVTSIASDGFYVTDVAETRGASSIFVFTFSTPYGLAACDRLTRLSGNVSDFFGGLQLGTAGWTVNPWHGPEKSGPCPIPAFTEIDGTTALQSEKLEDLESALVVVKNPVIGTHFGKQKVPIVGGVPIPGDGASNCDLNGDGIVGFNANKGGYSPIEQTCNDNCTADPDCTEWNNFVGFSQVKIKIAPTNAPLFVIPSAIPGFDVNEWVGEGKLAELRGVLSNFTGPTPAYRLEPRCIDDVIAASADPSTIKDATTACVRSRTGEDSEGSR